jgi:type I restriction enzyme M protein
LNAVRREFLSSFVVALLPLGMLDRFKLAGVIATWWSETLPDFKTLLENGFAGVIDGWVDTIADAVEDDEAAGPAFDPFSHKLVLRIMPDYLDQITKARSEVARLKSEKEAFEQSNPPEDADEEDLAQWNYAKDIERQIRELKTEHWEALKRLVKLEKAAAKPRATEADRRAADEARVIMKPVVDKIAELDGLLAPYEQIKRELGEARRRYGDLTAAIVDELKRRCNALTDDERRTVVLELFAKDVQTGLDEAVAEKRRTLTHCLALLWEKYRVTLAELEKACSGAESSLAALTATLGYS